MVSEMNITYPLDSSAWDSFVSAQPWSPFLQSWKMGDVYNDLRQPPVRLVAQDAKGIRAVCFGHIVDAKRGKHLSIPYGPLFDETLTPADFDVLLPALFAKLKEVAREHGCSFIRMSPFLSEADGTSLIHGLKKASIRSVTSPLHLLAEHVWYLPLKNTDGSAKKEDEILANMRKTTRNLVRRAERDGVTITASTDPVNDLEHFIALHDETRKRHKFTPYTNEFFRLQVKHFAAKNECTVYLADFQGAVIAASVHMHPFGETSYHHGASSSAHSKVPASYLLQWTAIKDALKRGDKIYNFWGIAPSKPNPTDPEKPVVDKSHPFAGVTLFKTGFGGEVHNLMHCIDIPVTSTYWLTYVFEVLRKWKRGF
jgi:lipid II:glycine glycyltransferase (peptidoglycan interpeptide bridge formation enzyme)